MQWFATFISIKNENIEELIISDQDVIQCLNLKMRRDFQREKKEERNE